MKSTTMKTLLALLLGSVLVPSAGAQILKVTLRADGLC